MTTTFKDSMMAQLEDYMNATEPPEGTKRRGVKNPVSYTCEVSGIDMIVSKIVGEKCTMQMCIFFSQTDEEGRGLIFTKNVSTGVIKKGDENSVSTFLRDLQGSMRTTSEFIPELRSGKDFARKLLGYGNPVLVKYMKEGIVTGSMLNKDYPYVPWFVANELNDYHYSSIGRGAKDTHIKLVKHMANALAKKYRLSYSDALTAMCNYRANESLTYAWAFSNLADIYDEPFAKKCFDEYMDNERLNGLDEKSFGKFFTALAKTQAERDSYYYADVSWIDVIDRTKNGKALVTLDKNRFWDFIQQAVGVGLGKSLDNYIDLYKDYLVQAMFCDGKIKDKYPPYLQVAHDIYSEKYRMIKEFRDKELLLERTTEGSKFIDQVHGDYQLKTLMTVEDFLTEAQQNCNCVASYVDKVKNGECWVASFRPVDSDCTQLTIEIDRQGWMVQIRGKFNRSPTEKERELLKPFKEGIRKNLKKLQEQKEEEKE